MGKAELLGFKRGERKGKGTLRKCGVASEGVTTMNANRCGHFLRHSCSFDETFDGN